MSDIRNKYIAAAVLLSAGALFFVNEAVRTPARRTRLLRRRGEEQQLQRLKESRQDVEAVVAAMNRLPETAPVSLEQVAAAWPELRPVVQVETKQTALEGWVLLRAQVTFDNTPFDRVWSFLSAAGQAEQRPPWRLVELAMTPSAPGRGQAVVTLEALRKTEASFPSRRVEP